MAKSTTESPSGRHRDLWRVEANRWVYSEYATPYARLLASKHERGPGLEQGEEIEVADVPDGPRRSPWRTSTSTGTPSRRWAGPASSSTFARRRGS